MLADISIDNLTTVEKLMLMERLWADLSQHPEDVPSPEWHRQIIAERMSAVQDGSAEFVDFDAAKRYLRDRLE